MIRHSVVLLAIAALMMAATAPPERVIPPGGVATVSVNGVPARVRIEPGGTSIPLLTAETARRAGLNAGMFAMHFVVGRAHVEGSSAVARIDLGRGPVRRRVGWTPRPYVDGFDGAFGPGTLPDPVVRFVFGRARPGERVTTMPLVAPGGIGGGWGERFGLLRVGDFPVLVRFDPYHPRTLATAAAAARIAAAHGGTLLGPTGQQDIAFGIARPVRAMHLARPLGVGPFAVSDLWVRTADQVGLGTVPDADADPNEIVVTARNGKPPKTGRLTIGQDLLSRCSSIVFDKPAKLVRLTCA